MPSLQSPKPGGPAAAVQQARAAPATLEGSSIPLATLRAKGRHEMLELLQAARGRKALVLDSALRGLLAYIVPEGTTFLRQNGVVHLCRGLHADLSFLTPEGREDDPDHVLYFVRPSLSNMRGVAAQIKKRNAASSSRLGLGSKGRSVSGSGSASFLPQPKYHLYFVPHKTFICEQALADEGVLDCFAEIGECQLDLFPLDTDLLSLELEASFKDCYVDGDSTMLTTVARSLHKLEASFGIIPHVKAKGTQAAVVLQRFLQLKQAHPVPAQPGHGPALPEIDTLVLLDRAVDLVTPLLTPLTYEGIIDEFIGIQHGAIKVDPSLVGDDPKEAASAAAKNKGGSGKDPVTIALNTNDPLYTEIRDLHLEVLGLQLNEKAMEMRQTYARVKEETRDGSLNEIHDVVKSIPALQQKYKGLNLHINIAEFLKPTTGHVRFQQRWQLERSMVEGETRYEDLEDMVAAYEPVTQVLRLLCLQSLTGGGLKGSKYELLKREVVQSYGYEYLFALANMEAVGLLKKSDQLNLGFGSSAGSWASLRRTLRLVKENVNTQVPDDMAYVSSGYAPLSVRLLQLSHKPGWAACPDILRVLPGPTLEYSQPAGAAPPAAVLQELDRVLGTGTSGGSGGGSNTSLPGTPTSGTSRTAGAAASGPVVDGKTLPASGKKVMLVYLVGGVTFMEIAAMRYLSKQKDFPYQIVVCSTKLINGNSFIKSTYEDLHNMLKR